MSKPRITPAPPTRLREPFDHPDWLFEFRHNGFRALACLEAGACQPRLPEPQCV
jgi:hypothetical protein